MPEVTVILSQIKQGAERQRHGLVIGGRERDGECEQRRSLLAFGLADIADRDARFVIDNSASGLAVAPGETTKTITIEVKGDSKKEANETFYLDLFGLSSNALFTKNRGVGTILNDD